LTSSVRNYRQTSST